MNTIEHDFSAGTIANEPEQFNFDAVFKPGTQASCGLKLQKKVSRNKGRTDAADSYRCQPL